MLTKVVILLALFMVFALATNSTISYSIGGGNVAAVSSIVTVNGYVVVAYDGNATPGPATTLLVFTADPTNGFTLVDNYTTPAACSSQIFATYSESEVSVVLACKLAVRGGSLDFFVFSFADNGTLSFKSKFSSPSQCMGIGDLVQQGNTSTLWLATIPSSPRSSTSASIWTVNTNTHQNTLMKSNMFPLPDLSNSYFTLTGVSPIGDLLFMNNDNRTEARYTHVYETTHWTQVTRNGPMAGVVIDNNDPVNAILALQNTSGSSLQFGNFHSSVFSEPLEFPNLFFNPAWWPSAWATNEDLFLLLSNSGDRTISVAYIKVVASTALKLVSYITAESSETPIAADLEKNFVYAARGSADNMALRTLVGYPIQ